jgi:hypothetical protein
MFVCSHSTTDGLQFAFTSQGRLHRAPINSFGLWQLIPKLSTSRTVKPPIFAGPPTADTPQQYLHRARMFRNAAVGLSDYVNGEPFWPRYALITHAIELALKAFVRHGVANGSPPTKEPSQHDLSGWYKLAIQYGLPQEPSIAQNIELLNELHSTHYTRYPQHRSAPIPAGEAILDSTVDHLIDTFTQTINPR